MYTLNKHIESKVNVWSNRLFMNNDNFLNILGTLRMGVFSGSLSIMHIIPLFYFRWIVHDSVSK